MPLLYSFHLKVMMFFDVIYHHNSFQLDGFLFGDVRVLGLLLLQLQVLPLLQLSRSRPLTIQPNYGSLKKTQK